MLVVFAIIFTTVTLVDPIRLQIPYMDEHVTVVAL